ncbi:MAG: hypothetical protein NTY77_10585 [Elusimicrobia bacterium]|nr:hypothetical protein [Elusimicrobiota bacterium]
MKALALALLALAAAPVHGVEVARVQVAAPVNSFITGASAVGARSQIGPLANPSLSGAGALSLTSKLAVPTLVPTVIPVAPGVQSYSAPSAAPQTVSAIPLSAPAALAPTGGASLLQQSAEQKSAPAAAVNTLHGFVAQMESSRVSGRNISNELSNRFFDQSGTRGPPLAVPAEASVSDVAAPKLPQGVTKVAVDTVRSAADVQRLIPDSGNSKSLKAKLKRMVSQMAPYQIYTYYDRKGGRFAGIDLSARPGLIDQIPELQQHEVKLIKKLMLVNSDIRVLVREDGKTPDLVIGDKLVEIKSSLGEAMALESLIAKANMQILEHGQRHGLGRGAMALDLTRQSRVPVAEVQGILDSWQAGSKDQIVLEQVIVFGQTDMQVFMRQADGTYRIQAPAAAVRHIVNERPLAPSERGRAQALLRNGIEKSPVLALSL